MSGRIASQHLAAAYDSNVRSLYRSMQRARRDDRRDDAEFCRDALNHLLQVRKDAREYYVSAPNPSTVAWRREQAAHEVAYVDNKREYMEDQMRAFR